MKIKKYSLEPSPRFVNCSSPKDEVYLCIEIGNAQTGGNIVTLDKKLLAKGDLSQPTYLGKVSDFNDETIEIETNVLDVNSFTNMCVITTTVLNQDKKVLFSKIDKGEAPENGLANFKGKYIFKAIAVLFCLFFVTCSSIAQEQNGLAFQHLQTPASPGFILLDQAPSSIEKPTTPQGFSVSVLGMFGKQGGAVEVAPFWLTTHPRLTAERLYETKCPILYTTAISGATIKNDSLSFVAGGIRSRILQHFGKKQIEELSSLKKSIIDELSVTVDELDLEKIEELRQEYIDVIEKPQFNVDIAAAFSGASITDSFNDLKSHRWAAWMAFNYRPKGNDFYTTLLSRYINYEQQDEGLTRADLIDIGSRLNYDISDLCLSVEYLQRINASSDDLNSFRVAAIGSYRISDTLFFTGSFGKNFGEVNNIIAVAGIDFGFSKNKTKAF